MDDQQVTIHDPDEEHTNQKDTYQQILLRQMQRCIDNLSKEVVGGHFKQKQTRHGVMEIWQEDVRHLIINSVETLIGLMQPFIHDEYEVHISCIYEEIRKFRKSLDDRIILFKGQGRKRVGDLNIIPSQTVVWQELIEYKAEKYREIFDGLMLVYNKYKEEIKEYEEE